MMVFSKFSLQNFDKKKKQISWSWDLVFTFIITSSWNLVTKKNRSHCPWGDTRAAWLRQQHLEVKKSLCVLEYMGDTYYFFLIFF